MHIKINLFIKLKKGNQQKYDSTDKRLNSL